MPSQEHIAAARRIHDSLPVVDGHNDLAWEIRVKAGGSLDEADPRRHLDGFHTDLPRLLEGGVGAQFWSVYVPTWSRQPFADTIRQIDLVDEMSRRAPDLTERAGDADDVERIRASGRVAGLLGSEGGHSIENSLEKLEALAERGVRYLTLTHGATNDWADSATDDARHHGLTDFGRAVVERMNYLGMLVDISHVSAETMRAAIEASRAPVIASHSSAFALAPHPRNVPDDVIEMVAAGGGVIMVTFVPAFLVKETALAATGMFHEERVRRADFADDDEAGYSAAARRSALSRDVDDGSVNDVADHIEHVARIGGVDHVGLGGDFDGVFRVPAGLEDVSCYPAITAELLDRGWSEGDMRKVLGENSVRVLRAADELANR